MKRSLALLCASCLLAAAPAYAFATTASPRQLRDGTCPGTPQQYRTQDMNQYCTQLQTQTQTQTQLQSQMQLQTQAQLQNQTQIQAQIQNQTQTQLQSQDQSPMQLQGSEAARLQAQDRIQDQTRLRTTNPNASSVAAETFGSTVKQFFAQVAEWFATLWRD